MAVRYVARGIFGTLIVVLCGCQEAAQSGNAPIESHIRKSFPNATIVSTKTTFKHFAKAYEARLDQSGKKMKVTLAPDGTLLEVDTQIAAENLPKVVADAAAEIVQGNKVLEVEMIERRGTIQSGKAQSLDKPEVYFEIEYTQLGFKREVKLMPDGSRRTRKASGLREAAKSGSAPIESHIKRSFPNATIVSTKTALKHFSKIHEAKLSESGKEIEVALAPDGTILKVERKIPTQELPKPVADAAAEIAKGGKIVEAEMIERRGTIQWGKAQSLDKPEVYFEIEYSGTLGIKSEAKLNPDGTRRVHRWFGQRAR